MLLRELNEDAEEISPKTSKRHLKKRERSFLILLILLTVLPSLVLAFVARRGKLPNLPRIVAPSVGFQETVVLERGTPKPQSIQNEEVIVREWQNLTRSLSGIYAFNVVELSTGDTYGVNQHEVMQAASLIKLPVMIAAYQEAERGVLSLESKYTLRNEDKIGGSGSMQYAEAGKVYTYRQLLELMGQQSDNTAFGVVIRKIGKARVLELMSLMGLRNTSIDENTTTPYEISMLFQKVHEGRLLTSKYKEALLSSLTDTIYESHLPKGVPPDIDVAHKYGREIHVVNDAGIVDAIRPYVVTIMTSGVVESEADLIFPELSRTIYSLLQER